MPRICPECGGHHVHHSRLRGWFEEARWRVTGRAPFRCHNCNWRGWRKDADPRDPDGAAAAHEIRPDLTESQLDEIDPGKRR